MYRNPIEMPIIQKVSVSCIVSCFVFFFSFLHSKNNVTYWKQKVSMATSQSNEHCQCMQNGSQRCKIVFISLSFSVLELLRKVPKGGGGGRIC